MTRDARSRVGAFSGRLEARVVPGLHPACQVRDISESCTLEHARGNRGPVTAATHHDQRPVFQNLASALGQVPTHNVQRPWEMPLTPLVIGSDIQHLRTFTCRELAVQFVGSDLGRLGHR